MKHLFLILLAFISFNTFAQEKAEAVVWKVSYIDHGNNEGEIVFVANIAEKHHIYSQKPTEAGPISTSFTISPNAEYNVDGNVVESESHEAFEEVFDAKVSSFEKEAIFKQKITRKTNKSFVINTYVEFTCCNDRMCLPPKTLQFMVTIPENANIKRK